MSLCLTQVGANEAGVLRQATAYSAGACSVRDDMEGTSKDSETQGGSAMVGMEKEVLELLATGADIEKPIGPMGTSPLHVAAFGGHEDTVRLLITSGANVSAQSTAGETPLHWAASQGHVAIAQLLLEHGADASAENNCDATPLQCAEASGHEKARRLLQHHGESARPSENHAGGPSKAPHVRFQLCLRQLV
ncbi:ankyrin repeat-containing domain protein [Baffinella frigidus]|nr:ankyrin repeat-containing domain protein [Cryptophyta sp. CCMP2293]